MRFFLLLTCLTLATNVSASNATDTLAEILIDLNHYPTENDKTSLNEIQAGADSTDEEKTLASAILRVAHKPAADDVAGLQAIEEGGSSPATRQIAAAILSINHKAAGKHRSALEKLIEP